MLVACIEPRPRQQFAPMRALCDDPEGPIRLLAVDNNERIVSRTVRAGDRWVAEMRDESESGAELLAVDGDGADLGRVDTDAAARLGPTFVQEVGRFEPTDWLAWVVDRRGRPGLYYAELASP